MARRIVHGRGGLFIASGSSIHERKLISRCEVPTADGICGHPFFEGEDDRRVRHAAQCAQANAEHVRAFLDRRHPDVMKPWDTELFEWLRGPNGALVLEGRKRV